MEAKDTVMKASELCLKVCQDFRANNDGGKNCDGLDCEVCQFEKQAEISFKAGIKEVVDFIGKEPFEHNYSNRGHEVDDCFACKWEAKLKEWGIED